MNTNNVILPGEELLLTLSQLALGLAGFAGIVGVFRRTGDHWKRQDFMGLRLILKLTLASAFLAQAPSLLFLWFSSTEIAIRYSSLLLAVFLAFFYVREMFNARKVRREGFPPRHPLIFMTFALPTGLLVVILLCNSRWWLNVAPFAGSISYLLVAASVQFFTLVNEQEKEADEKKAPDQRVPAKRQRKT